MKIIKPSGESFQSIQEPESGDLTVMLVQRYHHNPLQCVGKSSCKLVRLHVGWVCL